MKSIIKKVLRIVAVWGCTAFALWFLPLLVNPQLDSDLLMMCALIFASATVAYIGIYKLTRFLTERISGSKIDPSVREISVSVVTWFLTAFVTGLMIEKGALRQELPLTIQSLILISSIFVTFCTVATQVYYFMKDFLAQPTMLFDCEPLEEEFDMEDDVFFKPIIPQNMGKASFCSLEGSSLLLRWCLQKGLNAPYPNVSNQDAISSACNLMDAFFKTEAGIECARITAAIQAGQYIAAMEPGADRDRITELFSMCCMLSANETASLSVRDWEFIKAHTKREVSICE